MACDHEKNYDACPHRMCRCHEVSDSSLVEPSSPRNRTVREIAFGLTKANPLDVNNDRTHTRSAIRWTSRIGSRGSGITLCAYILVE